MEEKKTVWRVDLLTLLELKMGVPLYRSATIVPLCRAKITWIAFQLSNKPYEEVYPPRSMASKNGDPRPTSLFLDPIVPGTWLLSSGSSGVHVYVAGDKRKAAFCRWHE